VYKNITTADRTKKGAKTSKRSRCHRSNGRPLSVRLTPILGDLREVWKLLDDLENEMERGDEFAAEQLIDEFREKINRTGRSVSILRHYSGRVRVPDPPEKVIQRLMFGE
jgi:hypothetical protein